MGNKFWSHKLKNNQILNISNAQYNHSIALKTNEIHYEQFKTTKILKLAPFYNKYSDNIEAGLTIIKWPNLNRIQLNKAVQQQIL